MSLYQRGKSWYYDFQVSWGAIYGLHWRGLKDGGQGDYGQEKSGGGRGAV